MAQADPTLSIFIGESFAEAFLSSTPHSSTGLFHRWYLGKEGLRGGLQRFLQNAGIGKLEKAIVGSRFLEKIFSYRLGGSVATVTTAGFETWTTLRQPGAAKPSQLSSTELVFSIDERCDAKGHIQKEISVEAITNLIESLRAKEAKRVCIHFLNASKNPANESQLQKALLQEGFEVFVPAKSETSEDEVSRWRKNALNASVSGTFEEVQAEINLALSNYLPEGRLASFLSSDGSLFTTEPEHRLSSLWGPTFAWSQALRTLAGENADVLYLGLDQFSILYPGKTVHEWQSGWGTIAIPHVKTHVLSLQPTSAIEVNAWGALDFSAPLGYEPGPMFMGRGQAPALLDLWAEDLTGIMALEERRSAPGLQKFKNQMWALNKTSAEPFEAEEKVQPSLRELALQKLALDLQVASSQKKMVCFGTLAPIFFAQLKKRLPQIQFELRPESETASLLSEGIAHAR